MAERVIMSRNDRAHAFINSNRQAYTVRFIEICMSRFTFSTSCSPSIIMLMLSRDRQLKFFHLSREEDKYLGCYNGGVTLVHGAVLKKRQFRQNRCPNPLMGCQAWPKDARSPKPPLSSPEVTIDFYESADVEVEIEVTKLTLVSDEDEEATTTTPATATSAVQLPQISVVDLRSSDDE
ncbi:unnamed protein product [Trichogramma brassicae]|uniref:Uncharacterized protein n=1 Tax=Trichogramma brassicae TaxID=86971 RepID=A0A6H5IFU5_9HYME|nr:unnamed protein product [Trichogramma brassicae]